MKFLLERKIVVVEKPVCLVLENQSNHLLEGMGSLCCVFCLNYDLHLKMCKTSFEHLAQAYGAITE